MRSSIPTPITSSTSAKVAYSVGRLAELTGLSSRTWWRLIRKGQIATVRIGQRLLVTNVALVEFLQEHSDSTGAAVRQPPEHIKRKQIAVAARAEKRGAIA